MMKKGKKCKIIMFVQDRKYNIICLSRKNNKYNQKLNIQVKNQI